MGGEGSIAILLKMDMKDDYNFASIAILLKFPLGADVDVSPYLVGSVFETSHTASNMIL